MKYARRGNSAVAFLTSYGENTIVGKSWIFHKFGVKIMKERSIWRGREDATGRHSCGWTCEHWSQPGASSRTEGQSSAQEQINQILGGHCGLSLQDDTKFHVSTSITSRFLRRKWSLPVSQIWAFTVFASTLMDRVANSTPIVDLESRLNSFLVNRERRFDLPTPESPIRTTWDKDKI